MPLPTLLQTGFVVPPKKATKSEKSRINNVTGIDYFINFISDRIPIARSAPPKIPPKKAGDKVFVLKSGTGSGKSTVIPPYLYENFNDRARGNIAVTQPRVLTAKDIAEGTPENYKFMKIDVNLGFSTGSIKRLPSEKGVIYMTIGTILAEINNKTDEEFMRKYSFIIIDEVHDRDINVDMSLYKLKKLIELHYDKPECPFIILMSATFNPLIFTEYFDVPESNFMEFKGSTFPIEQHFAKYNVPDYLQYCVNKAEELHVQNISDIEENSNFRDILIFVQGKGQVKKIVEQLHTFNAKILSKPFEVVTKYIEDKKNNEKTGGVDSDKRYYIAPVTLTSQSFSYGGIEYQNLFSPINSIMIPLFKLDEKGNIDTKRIDRWVKPTRRIIVATNIAETGVTIETLKYCIDSGYVFSMEFNPDFGSKLLLAKNITKGMALQRKGRVGRKSPGNWYPCYTKEVFDSLAEDQFAQILSDDVTPHIMNIIITETESQLVNKDEITLSDSIDKNDLFKINYISDNDLYFLKKLKTLNFSSIDLIELPASESLVYSMEKLYGLGFIDSQFNPTLLGLYNKGFSKINIESVRMILAGYSYGANILDLITIASFTMLKSSDIFDRKYKPINVLKPKVADKDYDFYYKTIIGDQFVEYLLVWELYSEFLNNLINGIRKKSSKGQTYNFSINTIEKWCEDNHISYAGIIQITNNRDELLSSVISMGLNPYYNGMKLEKGEYNLLKIIRNSLDDGLSEIKKIKKCILDGYRFNLIIWDDTSKRYMLHHRNIPVYFNRSLLLGRMGDDAVQKNANFIIASEIMLFSSQKNPGMFEFQGNQPISIMDSLDIDINFLKH
jgi:HrpA-like RNA helicase